MLAIHLWPLHKHHGTIFFNETTLYPILLLSLLTFHNMVTIMLEAVLKAGQMASIIITVYLHHSKKNLNVKNNVSPFDGWSKQNSYFSAAKKIFEVT